MATFPFQKALRAFRPASHPLRGPRTPGDGPQRLPREVGDPRTVGPRGPMRPTVRPLSPHLLEREFIPDHRLSEMERLRRNLRWYAEPDQTRGKLLDRDIAKLRRYIAESDQRTAIREMEEQLKGLSPNSPEAQRLRQRLADAEATGPAPVVPSSTLQAQASSDAAATGPGAASASGGGASATTAPTAVPNAAPSPPPVSLGRWIPDRLEDFLANPQLLISRDAFAFLEGLSPDRRAMLLTWVGRRIIALGSAMIGWSGHLQDDIATMRQADDQRWSELADIIRYPDPTGEAAHSLWQRWNARVSSHGGLFPDWQKDVWKFAVERLGSKHTIKSEVLAWIEELPTHPLLRYLNIIDHWSDIRSRLAKILDGEDPDVTVADAVLLMTMAGEDPLMQLSFLYLVINPNGAEIITHTVQLVNALKARGVTVRGDILLAVMQAELPGWGDDAVVEVLNSQTRSGDFVYLSTEALLLGMGPIEVKIRHAPESGDWDAHLLLTLRLMQSGEVHPFDRWPLFLVLTTLPRALVENMVQTALTYLNGAAEVVRASGFGNVLDTVREHRRREWVPRVSQQQPFSAKDAARLISHVLETRRDEEGSYSDAANMRVQNSPKEAALLFHQACITLQTPPPKRVGSPANREQVALGQLKEVLRSPGFWAWMGDTSGRLQQSVREDIEKLQPLLRDWIRTPVANGRQFLAADVYRLLAMAGWVTLDDELAHDMIPHAATWTADAQRYVYGVLQDPGVPGAVAEAALGHLHAAVMQEAPHLPSHLQGDEGVAFTLSGMALLAEWQALSGGEARQLAGILFQIMQAAAKDETLLRAVMAYKSIVDGGYLTSEDIRQGLAILVTLHNTGAMSVSFAAALAVMATAPWVDSAETPPLASPHAGEIAAMVRDGAADVLLPVGYDRRWIGVKRVQPQPYKWNALWDEMVPGPEMRDPVLSVAARSLGLTMRDMWNPEITRRVLELRLDELKHGLTDEDAAYLTDQLQVVLAFFDSPQRREFWMRVAARGSVAAKDLLVTLLERRLLVDASDGPTDELQDMQQVRNALLGRPSATTDDMTIERIFLRGISPELQSCINNNKYWMVRRIDFPGVPPHAVIAAMIRELESARPIIGVSQDLRHQVVLEILAGRSRDVLKDYPGDVDGVYRLLGDENSQVAYGAAVVFRAVRPDLARRDVRVQRPLVLAALQGKTPYSGADLDFLDALDIVNASGGLTDDRLRRIAASKIARIWYESIDLEVRRKLMQVTPRFTDQVELGARGMVGDLVESWFSSLANDEDRETWLAALRALAKSARNLSHTYHDLTSKMQKLPEPWREKALAILRPLKPQ